MLLTIGGWRGAIDLFEEFDKVRGVGKGALVANLRNRFRGGRQQEAGVEESLVDKPPVGRGEEVAVKLLLEGGQRAVVQARQLLDGDLLEDVVVDNLLETLLLVVHALQHLALDATLLVGDKQVDQFGHLDVFCRLVVAELRILQVTIRVVEEGAQGAPRLHRQGVLVATHHAGVFVGDVEAIGQIQVYQNPLQLFGSIVEDNLLEGEPLLGLILDVVGSQP